MVGESDRAEQVVVNNWLLLNSPPLEADGGTLISLVKTQDALDQ